MEHNTVIARIKEAQSGGAISEQQKRAMIDYIEQLKKEKAELRQRLEEIGDLDWLSQRDIFKNNPKEGVRYDLL
jgi:hypothetical protein